VHGAVFHAETTTITGTDIDMNIYHRFSPNPKIINKNLQYQFIKSYRKPPRISVTYER